MTYEITHGALMNAETIVALAVIAVLASEGIKILFPVRRWFAKKEIDAWLGRDHAVTLLDAASAKRESQEMNALFDQPTPKLLGIIQSAATIILEARKEQGVIRSLVGMHPDQNQPDEVSDWMGWQSPSGSSEIPATALAARDVLEARLERRLDSLQARLDYQWTQVNKWMTVIVAGVVAVVVFYGAFATNSLLGTAYVGGVILIAAVCSALIEQWGSTRVAA